MGASSDPTASTPSSASRRRSFIAAGLQNQDGNAEQAAGQRAARKARHTKAGNSPDLDEKRLRRFRNKPPVSLQDVQERATTQKFFVLSRTRCGTVDCPEEMVELTGSTGNIYNIVIARQPACDCPHGMAGNQCKHVLFVLMRVLRAKYEYVYQLALLSTELQEIFANAPPILHPGTHPTKNDARKPVQGDCPICFDDLEGGGAADIVWCQAACGQNIHQGCFRMWATTKRRQGGQDVTCPYCRSVWVEDDALAMGAINKTGRLNSEGYVNVASRLGIGTERDYSTYSRFWKDHPNAYRRRYR